MTNKGYVSIHRKIRDNEIWTEESPFDRRSAWIDLIMMANIENKPVVYRGNQIIVKRGQVYTSIRKLSSRWFWGKDRVNRYINLLVELGMVERTTLPYATVLTIVKYSDYQVKADSHKDTGKDSHKDTHKPLLNKTNKKNKEINREPTAEDERLTQEILQRGWDDDE